MSNNVILKAENLHKSYQMGTTRLHVLKGADLTVKKGEFVAIIGASGSGKSTLLHLLGALDEPDKGKIKFHGKDLPEIFSGLGGHTYFIIALCVLAFLANIFFFKVSLSYALPVLIVIIIATIWRDIREPRIISEFRNKKVGFVFQFYHLLDELNVLENVYLPVMTGKSVIGWFLCRKQAKNRAKELLKQLGLSERATHKPYQLSGGERQRVAIGRALMNEPELLLADEPTGNLDSVTGNSILEVLENLNNQGQTIVMITHDERIAKRAGRTVTLVDGKIV